MYRKSFHVDFKSSISWRSCEQKGCVFKCSKRRKACCFHVKAAAFKQPGGELSPPAPQRDIKETNAVLIRSKSV